MIGWACRTAAHDRTCGTFEKDVIARFACDNDLSICRRFEEKDTGTLPAPLAAVAKKL